MGLRDFIENMRYGGLKDLASELSEIVKDASKEFGQLKREGRELFTDGFKEMVLKGNADYKTSFEKDSEAGKIVLAAMARYQKGEDKLRAEANQLIAEVAEHHQYVDTLMRGTVVRWHERADSWGDLRLKEFVHEKQLDLKVLSLMPDHGLKKVRKSRRKFDAAAAAPTRRNTEAYWPDVPGLPPLMFLNVGGIFAALEQQARVKAANDFLEDAKDFRLEIKKQLQEFRETETQIQVVSLRIKECGKLLHVFEGHLRKLIPRVRPSKVTGQLTVKGFELARMSSLTVSAIVALSKDSLLDPTNQGLTKQSSLYADIRQLNKLLGSYI